MGLTRQAHQELIMPAVTAYRVGQLPEYVGYPVGMKNTVSSKLLSLCHAGWLNWRVMLLGFLLLLLPMLKLVAAAESELISSTSTALLTRNIQFTNLSVSEGLSQATVNAVVQDQEGYLWFATQEGLNRYDGYDIVVYQHDASDPRSLANDFLWTLFVDRAGRLWIGSDGGGLSRYEPETDDFTHYQHKPDDPKSLSNNRVRAIYEDQDGRLWIGTDGGGLNRFVTDKAGFIHYRYDVNDSHSLPNDKIMTILEDRSGVMWIGTDGGGLSRFDRKQEIFTHFQHDPDKQDSLSDDRIRVLFEERNGRLWIGTYAGGINLFNPIDGSFKRFQHNPHDPFSLSNDEVRDIAQDSEGTVWIATDAGLDEWRPNIQGFIHYTHDPLDSSSLANNRVTSVMQGRDGVLWVGSYAGISHWNYISDAFAYYDKQSDGSGGLSNNLITGISESPDGKIWVGTYGGGLNRLDPMNGEVVSYQHDPLDDSSLGDNRVMAVFADEGGSIWVGTKKHGLSQLDTKTHRFEHFRHNPLDKHSIGGDGISCIYGEGDGMLWVGAMGGGLNRLDLASGKFVTFRHDPNDNTSISSDRVLSIYRDRSGTLWIGTEDGGVNRFNEAESTFTHYRQEPAEITSISSDKAWAILEGRDGSLWIATRDGGLNRWLPQDRIEGRVKFKRYGKAEGLVSNTVYGILEDDVGTLWLSSNRGLSRLNPDTGIIRHFDDKNGLQADEFNFGANHRSNHGILWFGGTKGLVMFDPSKVRSNPHLPPVAITAYSHLTPVARSHSKDPVPAQLTLKYPDYSISFEFTALDFTSSDKNQYHYMLQGFDADWLDSGRFRRATYTNLPAGNYTFKVKASNNDGIWSDDLASIALQVKPPPWKTTWAYIGYAILMLSFIGAVIRVQANKLKQESQQRKELEIQVQLRTRELAERNFELEELTSQLEKASVTDPLTGLKNRRYLHQYMESEIPALMRLSEGQTQAIESLPTIDISAKLSFIMIDLDGFKPINDTYGHHAGDQALIQVRDILRNCCRKSDTIVRWGGDEFFIVGRHASRAGLEKYVERIRIELSSYQYQVGGGHVARLSGSIGMTMFPFTSNKQQHLTWEQVVNLADQAAYLAKENGRNAWVGIYGDRKFNFEDMYERLNTDMGGLVKQGMVDVSSSIERPLVYANRTQQKNA